MKEMICIVCPNGCRLTIDDTDGIRVSGNKCPRGIAFATEELTAPKRSVTGSVATTLSGRRVVSVRTDGEIPKDKIFDLVALFNTVTITRPMKIGEVVIENALDTGVNVILTTDLSR